MIIDARVSLRLMDTRATRHAALPVVTWQTRWDVEDGTGVSAGVLDGAVAVDHPDLAGAKLTVRRFLSDAPLSALDCTHATHTVTTLVGQGRAWVRGIAPEARLFVASVVGPTGIARSEDVVAALKWLDTCQPTILIIPLGGAEEDCRIVTLLADLAKQGVQLFAAAGNSYPDLVHFPAREAFAIATGAVDNHGELLTSCCREPHLDLVAPGLAVWGATAVDRAQSRGGSSTACVIAAGAALLATSVNRGAFRSPGMLLASLCVPTRETRKSNSGPLLTDECR